MRRKVDPTKLREFMRRLAQASRGPGTVYFTGGATMMLLGIRDQTIDIDLKLDPEPPGVFEAIARLKEELELNVELASPDDFLPSPHDWREQSILIESTAGVGFYHYDLRMQALAKLERSQDQDLTDVSELLRTGAVSAEKIWKAFEEIKPLLIRYPAVHAGELEKKILRFPGMMKVDEGR
jgi:hypothetical protein